mgnify:CR=1 FL=1
MAKNAGEDPYSQIGINDYVDIMQNTYGLDNSWDIALSGSFEEVAEGLEKYVEAGATQVVAAVYGPQESQKETISQLAKLL